MFTNNIGENLSANNFAQIFGGLPIWMSGYSNPWINANSFKEWVMKIDFYSPGCGWVSSTALRHYFKINTACPNWFSVPNPVAGGDDSKTTEAEPEANEREGIVSGGTMDIRAYPNPVTETLILDVSNQVGIEMQIDLFDMAGRVVKSFAPSLIVSGQKQIDVSNFASGTYFYRCQMAENQYRGKFIKN